MNLGKWQKQSKQTRDEWMLSLWQIAQSFSNNLAQSIRGKITFSLFHATILYSIFSIITQ